VSLLRSASLPALTLHGTTTLDVRRGRSDLGVPLTVREVAERWMESLNGLRPRTVADYERTMRLHILPRFGGRLVESIEVADLLDLLKELDDAQYTAWTVRTILTPFSRLLSHAVRTGLIDINPVTRLDRWDRPSVRFRAHRILDRREVRPLLDAAPSQYRTVLAGALFTGLRQNELLALRWKHLDFRAGLVRVRNALDRHGNEAGLKTDNAVRDVVLIASLSRLLKEHQKLSQYREPEDFIFASRAGSPLHWRNVTRRCLTEAIRESGIQPLRWHDLRHTYASMLIATGASITFVSRQMGHASPHITLRVYGHLFDGAKYAKQTRQTLEQTYGSLL
jgi:integrase